MTLAIDPVRIPVRLGELAAVELAGVRRRLSVLERSSALGPGGVTDDKIDTVTVEKLTGTLDAGDAARVDVGSLTGTLDAGDFATIDVTSLTGTLVAADAANIGVGALTGTLTTGEAARVNVGALLGNLDASSAAHVVVTNLTGTLDASSAADVDVGALVGSLTAADAADITVGALTGTLTTGDAARITIATLTGTLTSADPARVAASAITAANLAAITANIGVLTIEAGGKIRTAASGARVELGTSIVTSGGTYSGLVAVDASNAVTALLDAATGNVSLKGQLLTGSTGLGNLDGRVANTSSALFVTNPSGGGVTLVADSIATRELAVDAVAAGNIAADAVTAREFNAIVGGANKIVNATFNDANDPTDGYTFSNATPTAPIADDSYPGGGRAIGLTATGAGYIRVDAPAVPVNAGKRYVASGYGAPAVASRAMQVGIEYRDVSNAVTGYDTPGVVALGGAQRRASSAADAAPAGSVTARMYWVIGVDPTLAAPTAGDYFEVTGPQLEEGEIATAFNAGGGDVGSFTGSTFRTSAAGARLEVTPGGLAQYDAGGDVVVELTPGDGLNLASTSSVAAPAGDPDRAVGWLNAGDVVAEVYGYRRVGTDSGARLDVFSEYAGGPGAYPAYSLLRALDEAGNIYATVYAETASSNATSFAKAQAGGFTRTIVDGGTGGSSFTISDERAKKGIRPLRRTVDPLERIGLLEGKSFRWRKHQGPAGPTLGLIAQDVLYAVPEAVGMCDEQLTVEPAPIIALLVEAVKELDARTAPPT